MAKMFEEHKSIIKEFIDDDISTINMYWGYKGDFVLKIATKDPNVAFTIEDYAKDELEIEAVTKQETGTGLFNVFCIADDPDVYDLKRT